MYRVRVIGGPKFALGHRLPSPLTGEPIMSSLAVAALAASLVVGQAQGQSSTPDTLKEYGEAMVGDWNGKVELVHDMPGAGKAGETIEATTSIRWILRKSALEGRWKAGTANGKWIVVWDPAEKGIRNSRRRY